MSLSLSLMQTLKLNSGHHIPTLGFGTWQIKGQAAYDATLWALKAGYRHIDTAKLYGNEVEIGRAIKDSGIPRDQIFVTTKLWPTDFGHPQRAFEASLERLALDYVDLYLIHWPRFNAELAVWRQFEAFQKAGLARSIGVSNYGRRNLSKLLESAQIVPAVNQIELHPYAYNAGLVDYCIEKGIVIEAYSPLGHGSLIKRQEIIDIATKYNKTAAQLLIGWNLQHGWVSLPKSANRTRIIENCAVWDFEIRASDMQLIDNLA